MTNQRTSTDKKTLHILADIAQQVVNEQRRTRRWKLFFRFTILSLAVFFIFSTTFVNKYDSIMEVNKCNNKHTALIEIFGTIGEEHISSDEIIKSLNIAYSNPKTAGIIIRINSPGGSPVHSSNIYNEIIRLKEIYDDVPIFTVIDDICASGGYYIASATNEIYANQSSLVGSIGVISSGFGFVGAIKSLGITRRLYTAGENKAFLDSFTAVNEIQEKHWQNTLNKIHQQFIHNVKQGRGDKLKDNPLIFSGMVWAGEDAISYGLIDGFGDCNYIARDIIKVENIVDFTKKTNVLEKLIKDAKIQIKSSISKEFFSNKVLF